jgi:hypothetical protein
MEFTNTFEGGLNKDSNILLQPRGTYRDMNNGMLVSYDGNDYVVELPKGTKTSFTIPAIYNAVYTVKQLPPSVIGYISFIDTLVVFSTNSAIPGYGEIGQVSFDKDGIGTYTPLYGHVELNFSIEHQITGFTFEENDRIKRVYWTDNFNQPRVLNVKDPAFTEINSGDLVNGEQYMVVGGAISYSSTNYGPGLTATNVFTAGATTTYTVVDGNPKVYQYIDYKALSWYPDRINPEIDFNKYVPGTLYGGSKSYFIRLSIESQGITSAWSYGSFPINVYSIGDYSSFNMVQGAGAGGTLATTTTGVELKISGIDYSYYDTIEVAAAEYDQANNLLRSANIFATEKITGETMFIQHTSEGGTELTLEDLTIFPASILRVKDITTNKNYNIIGNITEREELQDFDKASVSINDLSYLIPSDSWWDVGTAASPTNAGLPKQPSAGVASGNLYLDACYLVTGGVVNYNGTNYGDLQTQNTFQVTTTLYTYSVVSGSPLVRACIRTKRYKTSAGVDKWKAIPLNDDFFDYRGMATTQYLRQYWSNETYRFAVVPYDKKGDPMYARWLGDHQVQSLGDKGGPMKYNTYSGSGFTPTSHSLRINGIRISGLTFSPEDIDKMSGFSIMRAPRDKQYYAQGILFQTCGTSISPSGSIQQVPLAQLNSSAEFVATSNNYGNIMNWHSPDALFNYYTPSAGKQLEGDCFVRVPSDGTISSLYSFVYADECNSKWYEYDGQTNQQFVINRVDGVNPGGSITGYYLGVNYDNLLVTVNGAYSVLNGGKAVGCKTFLMELNGFPNFPNGNGMGSVTEQYNTAKPLMNFKIPKTNLYGGTTPSALANTIYIPTGHYQRIDSSVKADTFDGTNYVFDEIDVFGGDSFLGIFSLGKSLYRSPAYTDSFSYGIFYPIESSINHYLRQGLNIEQYGMHNSSSGVYYDKNGSTNPEQFLINPAYTSDGVVAYPALPITSLVSKFPYRVRWAGAKTSGEGQDSFRTFPQLQFRDLDGNKGQINNVRNRDGKVFFWQDHSIGYLPILERQVINGAIGEATQLGVSGVIDRFDNFNTYFGNQHKFGLIETEYGFAWFDFRRRAFLVMTVGGGIQEVSFVKGLRTFFNSPQQFYASQLTNPVYELQNNDTPLLGIGISGVYDPNYKMTYMNFKWVEGEDENPIYWKNLTVGYQHSRNVFVGFFDLKGAVWQNHNNLVLANKNIEDNEINSSTDYIIGNNVTKDNIEYVCVKDFTTSNPVAANQQPDYVGSIYWAKTNQANESHLLFSTLNFTKFFGQTYNHDIEFVINPKTGKPFAVDNLRQKSNDVNYDIIECTTDDDNSTEFTNNKWYRYIDKSWNSSVPLGTKGRLVDFYLKVKYTLKTYTNIPTNSRNLQKVFEFITSVFREKR